MRTKYAIGGFAAGVAAMYFADRHCGGRRRAVTRDKALSAVHHIGIELGKLKRDAGHRTAGLVAAVQRPFRNQSCVHPAILEARVRACLGRVGLHPHAVTVHAEPEGRVILTGPVLAREVNGLVKAVRSVPGAREVINGLAVHDRPGNVPDLQGGGQSRGTPIGRERWSPATRAGFGLLGGAAIAGGLRTEGPAGWLTTLAGTALLTRAAVNRALGGIFGFGSHADTVHIDKSIHIAAQIEVVYAFWANFENFPRFMSHLKEVRNLGNGRSHWVAKGPAGVPVGWDAEITAQVENVGLSWQSLPSSAIHTVGEVQFELDRNGCTQVSVHMSYTPPAGLAGHAVASLFGADPKSEMDDDLIRLKSLLEEGRTRAHGRRVTLHEVAGEARVDSSRPVV